ncbi:HMG1/2-like protein [Chrysoperla carnea]|uniref:HMG1/2-like protein n=1 Tax=Chrysoperla carnea TaxID=189513 RepID=UPI001D096BBA|nr:HMG1/2-like protein [Chrysoperla carnea]
MSDDSELDDEQPQYDIYQKKYQLLLERCDVLQQDNERLVNRLYYIKKMVKRRKVECKFIMDRLDSHGDDWRNAPAPEQDIKPDISNLIKPPTIKVEKGIGSNSKVITDKSKKKVKKKPTKSEKPERDPNAPKRPANPFFQFCQEQRTIVMERLNSELKPGEPEPSKQELTRQLAIKWKTLTSEDKQVYVDMYERSKEKYAIEMDAYNCKN